MQSINFLLLYDLNIRDKNLIEDIALRLSDRGFSVKVARLIEEKKLCSQYDFDVVVINKPHFFYPFRILNKLRGVKYVVLDTEGVLPGQNAQHSLLEPEGYIHWFSHQAERYKFKNTKILIAGYPRAYQIKKVGSAEDNKVTIATNFSVIGYSDKEIEKNSRNRQLKLKNDWNLEEYLQFQLKCLEEIKTLILNNSNLHFILKFHPNDPYEIQDIFKSLDANNFEIFDHQKSIYELFAVKPKYHICFDGCTTILDAYCAGIDTITISRFPPFDESKMKGMEVANIQAGNTILKERYTQHSDFEKSDKQFLSEIKMDALGKIPDFLEEIITLAPKFRIYDSPTKQHFLFWLIFIIKLGRSTRPRRLKISAN